MGNDFTSYLIFGFQVDPERDYSKILTKFHEFRKSSKKGKDCDIAIEEFIRYLESDPTAIVQDKERNRRAHPTFDEATNLALDDLAAFFRCELISGGTDGLADSSYFHEYFIHVSLHDRKDPAFPYSQAPKPEDI